MSQKLRIAFIADGRSSHTSRWLSYFVNRGHEINLLTTYPCDPMDYPGVTIHNAYLWFRAPDASQVKNPLGNAKTPNFKYRVARKLRLLNFDGLIRPLWQRFVALETWHTAAVTRRVLDALRPDVVHALRIPIEGYVAALANYHPLVVSSWGCDFIYWRPMNKLHQRLTDRTLRAADAFIADCERDQRLAFRFGFAKPHATAICPGAGGVRFDMVDQGAEPGNIRLIWEIPENANIVLYNRGIGRPYYRFETFISAIPLILRQLPNTFFMVLGGENNPHAQRLIRKNCSPENVRLLPYMRLDDLIHVLKASQITVSPSIYDGTPNSMLEAMACGCFPVMSDLESIREWIQHGVNGLLFGPDDPVGLSQCVIHALRDEKLRRSAAKINGELVRRQADYFKCMSEIESLYRKILYS